MAGRYCRGALSALVATLFIMDCGARGVRAQQVAPCDRAAGRQNVGIAEAAFGQKDYRKAERFALLATAAFGACARNEQQAQLAQDAFDMANATLLTGASQLQLNQKEQARLNLAVAYRMFVALQRDPATSPNVAEQSRIREAKLLALDPRIPNVPIPLAASTQTPPNDVTLDIRPMNAWRSLVTNADGSAASAFLHIRVHVEANAPVTLNGNSFRITAFSPTTGQETIRGLSQAAPSYKKYNYMTNPPSFTWTPTVDPSEDLGALGTISFAPGDQRAFVITFPVRATEASSDADLTSISSTLVFLTRSQ